MPFNKHYPKPNNYFYVHPSLVTDCKHHNRFQSNWYCKFTPAIKQILISGLSLYPTVGLHIFMPVIYNTRITSKSV